MELPTQPYFDIWINENDIVTGAKQIVKNLRPSWIQEKLNHKIFTNGISNKLVGIWNGEKYNEMILVRVYGNKTDLLIDRKAEIRNIQMLHEAGHTYGIYATFKNGLAYEFIEGETLTVDSVKCEDIYQLVSQRMAKMHLLNMGKGDSIEEPVIWKKTEKFMSIMPKSFETQAKQLKYQKLIKPYKILVQEFEILREKLSRLDSPVVFSHNDLLLTNILYNEKEKKITFIDFEYADFNYQAYDIANHFAEFSGVDEIDYSRHPSEEFQKKWLTVYLKTYNNVSDVLDEDVDKLYNQVNQFVLLSHFFWGCWALIQSQYSSIDFDFLEYAAIRFNEYFRRKSFTLTDDVTNRHV